MLLRYASSCRYCVASRRQQDNQLLGREREGRMIWDDRRVAGLMPTAATEPPV